MREAQRDKAGWRESLHSYRRWVARWAAAWTLVVWLVAGAAFAAEVRILPLSREGNASLILSEENASAIIIDGGKAGRGNTALNVDGVPLLRWLHQNGYRSLAFVCSHPHSDHNGKIREIVGYVAEGPDDVDLTRFSRVLLADSDYPTEGSLASISRSAHGEVANITHVNATRTNLSRLSEFAPFTAQAEAFKFDTLGYQPGGQASIHGRAILTETRLMKDGHLLVYLDPDDADERAIRAALAGRGPLKEGTLLLSAPHHGSRFADLSVFEQLGWKPSSIVFQANAGNVYDHPHPEAWLEAVRRVGKEYVYVTGAGSRDLVFDGGRLKPLTAEELERVSTQILQPKVEAAEREVARLNQRRYEKPREIEDGRLKARRQAVGLRQEALAQLLDVSVEDVRSWESGAGVPAEKRDLAAWVLHQASIDVKQRDQLHRIRALRRVGASYAEGLPSDARAALLAGLRRLPPDGGVPPSGVDPAGGAGGISEAAKRNWPKPPIPVSGSGGVGDGTAQFRQLASEAYGPISTTGSVGAGGAGHSGTSGRSSGRAETRAVHFSRASRGRVVFGGVVIGNEVKGPCVLAARLWGEHLTVLGEEVFVPYLEAFVQTAEGVRTVRYDDWTPAELWSAYHLISPSELSRHFGTVEAGEGAVEGGGGVVGMIPGTGDQWEFAIHPAVASTPLAVDAMLLDMLPAYLRGSPLQESFVESDLFATYQWVDVPALVVTDGERLRVRAQDPKRDLLLGLRFVKDVDDYDLLIKAHQIEPLITEGDPSRLDERIDDVLRAPGNEAILDVAADDARLVKELALRVEVVRRVERFARAVAVLNWLADQGQLPVQMHPLIRPLRISVPAELSIRELTPYVEVADFMEAPAEVQAPVSEVFNPGAEGAAGGVPCGQDDPPSVPAVWLIGLVAVMAGGTYLLVRRGVRARP